MSRAALKSNKLLLTLAVALIGLAAFTAFIFSNNKKVSETTQQTEQSQTAMPEQQPISYVGEEGKTALELLKANFEVVTQDSSFGAFVVSINGEEGNGPKYWAYYVDGTLAQVGAGEYETNTGERIEWKLE